MFWVWVLRDLILIKIYYFTISGCGGFSTSGLGWSRVWVCTMELIERSIGGVRQSVRPSNWKIWGLLGAISKGWRAENACILHQNDYVGVGRVAFRRVGEQEMHVCCIRMAIWGWSGAISEGWRAGNACIVHQICHSELVGCHFGGSRWRGQWLRGLAVRIAETTRSSATGNQHTLSRQRRFYDLH